MEEKKIRQNWIDSAKAISILIVVLNHSSLRIPGVNYWGGMFFVSAFFVLSGYTYHVSSDSFGQFVLKKAKRLLVPYGIANVLLVCVGILQNYTAGTYTTSFLARSFVGVLYGRYQIYVSGQDPIYLFVNLNSPTWFLPALFLSLIIMEGLQRGCRKDNKKIWLWIVSLYFVATVYHYFGNVLLPWCLDMMPYFLFMMMVGYQSKAIFSQENFKGIKKFGGITGLLIVCLVSGLINGSFNLSISDTGVSVTLMCLSAISSSLLLMVGVFWLDKKFPVLSGLLAGLGRHSLTILCYHFFIYQMAVSFLRILHNKTGLILSNILTEKGSFILEELLAMTAAVTICILTDIIIKKLSIKK